MRQTPELDRAQEQMRSGVITAGGFLGEDRRSLAEILDADDSAVTRLGVSHEILAGEMCRLRSIGREALGLPADAGADIEVRVESIRGVLPCPFGERGVHGKSITMVNNRRLKESIQFSDLQLHLIQRHGFYQGQGALYRLNPEKIVRVLQLHPPDPSQA